MKPSGDLILPTERRRLAFTILSPAFAFGRPSPHSLAQLATLTGRQPIVMSPPSPPPGLCVPMLGGSRLYKGGRYWPPWGKWWQLSDFHFKARGRANFEASVQAPGRLEGQPVRWSGLFTAGHIGDFVG